MQTRARLITYHPVLSGFFLEVDGKFYYQQSTNEGGEVLMRSDLAVLNSRRSASLHVKEKRVTIIGRPTQAQGGKWQEWAAIRPGLYWLTEEFEAGAFPHPTSAAVAQLTVDIASEYECIEVDKNNRVDIAYLVDLFAASKGQVTQALLNIRLVYPNFPWKL